LKTTRLRQLPMNGLKVRHKFQVVGGPTIQNGLSNLMVKKYQQARLLVMPSTKKWKLHQGCMSKKKHPRKMII